MRKITLIVVLMACAAVGYAQSSRTVNQTNGVSSALRNYTPVNPAAVIFTDNMDGDNSIAGLNARGYVTYFRGSGAPGILPEWVQGDPTAYVSYNGPDSGYVGSSYNSVVNNDDLDNWLCLPAQNVVAGDTFSFFATCPMGSNFPDSVRVMYNVTGATLPEDTNWVQIDNFLVVNDGTWQYHAYAVPATSATGVFAIRHTLVDAGPAGNNSDFLGIDQIDVFNDSVPPVGNFDDCAGAVDINSAFGGAVGVVTNMGPYNNDAATTDVNDPATGWECFGEPDGSATAPELNNTVWFTFTGDGSNYLIVSNTSCAGVVDPIEDGDTQFALYTGTCGSLTSLKCNEDYGTSGPPYPAGLTFGTTAGATYYLMVDGFSFNGALSNGDFCLNISKVASIACTDPTISSGTQAQTDTIICDGDSVTVSTSGAIAPNTGDYFGMSWIVSSADISNNPDPLTDPSVLGYYTFSSVVPATSSIKVVNDGTSTIYIPGSVYYITPVVFGNAVAATSPPVFLGDLTLDPNCTTTGTSMMINLLLPGDPLCVVGVNENLPGAQTSMMAYPSPAQDVLHVDFTSSVKENAVIEITDYTGRVVYSTSQSVIAGVNKVDLNVKSLASGAYFVAVKGDASRTVKFVKQ